MELNNSNLLPLTLLLGIFWVHNLLKDYVLEVKYIQRILDIHRFQFFMSKSNNHWNVTFPNLNKKYQKNRISSFRVNVDKVLVFLKNLRQNCSSCENDQRNY